MSYNGTVRCSFCYELGHNKRSCPERKALVKQSREQGVDNWHTREDDRYKQSKRKCGYCGETGHNVRTCSHIKNDMRWLSEADQIWRKRVVEHYKNKYPGMGYGSLVKATIRAWNGTIGDWTTLRPTLMLEQVYPKFGVNFWSFFNRDHYYTPGFLKGKLFAAGLPDWFDEWAQKNMVDGSLWIPTDSIPGVHSGTVCQDNLQQYPPAEIEVVGQQSPAAFDYMFGPFLERVVSKRDFGGDFPEWRQTLKSVMLSLAYNNNSNYSTSSEDFKYVLDACGPPPILERY